jgi:hypothetical protein
MARTRRSNFFLVLIIAILKQKIARITLFSDLVESVKNKFIRHSHNLYKHLVDF